MCDKAKIKDTSSRYKYCKRIKQQSKWERLKNSVKYGGTLWLCHISSDAEE